VRLPRETWQELASLAGGIGRWVVEPESGRARIDRTLREMTGLEDWIDERDASSFTDRVDPDDRAEVEAALADAMKGAADYRTRFRFHRPDGRLIWLEGTGRLIRNEEGAAYLVGVNVDVTSMRQGQERAELLAGEMAHRLKNVLSLVGSMFNMAARTATSVDDLRDAYSGRLSALAKVNDLTFTAGGERDARIGWLVDAVLGPLIASGRVTARLDPCELNPAAAQTFILVLNELVTNAAKYGALSVEDGVVSLEVRLDRNAFLLSWKEEGGPAVHAAPARQGYGMRVLTAMTAATYEGKPVFDWRPDGLTFSCSWPLGVFATPAGKIE
jgi:PAS domain S-box-containing protein